MLGMVSNTHIYIDIYWVGEDGQVEEIVGRIFLGNILGVI